MIAGYMEIALTTKDEIVAAERRGYERALRQDGFEPFNRIQPLLLKLNSFGELKY